MDPSSITRFEHSAPSPRDAEAWLRRAVDTWRRTHEDADAAGRMRALNYSMAMSGCLSATFIRCHSLSTPVVATALRLCDSTSDAMALVDLPADAVPPGGFEHAFQALRSMVERRELHWRVDGAVEINPHLSFERDGQTGVVFSCLGTIWQTDAEAFGRRPFLDETLRISSLRHPAAVRTTEHHAYASGQARETITVRRTFRTRAEETLAALGLFEPSTAAKPDQGVACGYWVAFGVPSSVLRLPYDGDVDVLAGRLCLKTTTLDVMRRAERYRGITSLAALDAANEGLIEWPPNLDYLVAAEAKVSWFEEDSAMWKNTHLGKPSKIVGQVQRLLDAGIDRVSLLHLGVSMPTHGSVFHAAASSPMATSTFPVIFERENCPDAGYVSSFIHAVAGRLEHEEGATEPFFSRIAGIEEPYARRRRFAPLNERRKTAASSWRRALGGELAKLEKPLHLAVFLGWCVTCRQLSSSPDPLERCCRRCGGLLAAEREPT